MNFIKIVTAYFIESPLFEISTEDGQSSDFNLQIVSEDEDGIKRTLNHTFHRFDTVDAQALADKIVAHGSIIESLWHEGTSWDHYATAQTYSEEKLEREWTMGAAA